MVLTTRWVVTDYQHNWLNGYFTVHVTTDIPAHLTMLYTGKAIRLHLRQKVIRGVSKLTVPDYCFVEYQALDQEEAGDTLVHTFTFGPWEPGQCYSFRFIATIDGEPSSSDSGIFLVCYHDPGVFELGIFDTLPYLHGAVNLKAGSGIELNYDEANHAIMITGH